ncbi:hypothetical protein FQA39_LY16701 [Lamprigera yunnana]|nr:hypothetical protein FQA39_LY16701 [Lamprigera yunnana]
MSKKHTGLALYGGENSGCALANGSYYEAPTLDLSSGGTDCTKSFFKMRNRLRALKHNYRRFLKVSNIIKGVSRSQKIVELARKQYTKSNPQTTRMALQLNFDDQLENLEDDGDRYEENSDCNQKPPPINIKLDRFERKKKQHFDYKDEYESKGSMITNLKQEMDSILTQDMKIKAHTKIARKIGQNLCVSEMESAQEKEETLIRSKAEKGKEKGKKVKFGYKKLLRTGWNNKNSKK